MQKRQRSSTDSWHSFSLQVSVACVLAHSSPFTTGGMIAGMAELTKRAVFLLCLVLLLRRQGPGRLAARLGTHVWKMSACLDGHQHISELTLGAIWLQVAALSTASLVTGVVGTESRIVNLDFPTVVNFACCVCAYQYGCSQEGLHNTCGFRNSADTPSSAGGDVEPCCSL